MYGGGEIRPFTVYQYSCGAQLIFIHRYPALFEKFQTAVKGVVQCRVSIEGDRGVLKTGRQIENKESE